MSYRTSAFASATPATRRNGNTSTASQADILSPYKFLHELLKEAGLRACRVEPNRSDDSWSVSAIHRGMDDNWLACQMVVHQYQLDEAFEDEEAHRTLVSHLAKALAPCARNVA